MMNKVARIISTLFVPPAFTIIVFTLFAFTLEEEPIKIYITIIVSLVFGFAGPIILFIIFRKRGKIVDLDASDRRERTIPFSLAVLFYLFGLFILILFKVNIISIAFWFCYISNTIITIIINLKWKISTHAMGAAGPLAAVTYVFGPILLPFSALAVLVGYSRIQLKVHTISQVAAGILFAFFSTYLQMSLIVCLFE